jgi:hypothetical protein
MHLAPDANPRLLIQALRFDDRQGDVAIEPRVVR